MTIAQTQAADPNVSAWVGASAGTGKTKVLTDRVLRLLLDGAKPGRLLCLTYTKAAAAEMKNRVHARLASWAVADEATLASTLKELTHQIPDAEQLIKARQLFATVLDTPDGIKIQTIHAFCQMLIRRFPVEADVPPHFQVMDEVESSERMNQARIELLSGQSLQEDERLRSILSDFTWKIDEGRFDDLLQSILMDWKKLLTAIDAYGGIEPVCAEIYRVLEVKSQSANAYLQERLSEPECSVSQLKEAVQALQTGTKTDQERAEKLTEWLMLTADQKVQAYEDYLQFFLTSKYEPRQKLMTKKPTTDFPQIVEFLNQEQERVVRLWDRFKSLKLAKETTDLLYVADAILSRYRSLKTMHVRLDYQDLVHKAIKLLCESGSAQWVLYKLDGGIDHILIDEAQDTSPEQWRVAKALCDEFFAGQAVRETNRTLFVVGDEKQSIYSFQGADPDAFDVMHGELKAKCIAANKQWRTVPLERSFRSTQAVLDVVDEVFSQADLKAAVTKSTAIIKHEAHRADEPGRVELWPLVSVPIAEPVVWPLPKEAVRKKDAPTLLAETIANTIADWLENKRILPAKGRPVRAGDILILLQTRGKLASHLNKALKARYISVAGADRLVITEHLAVKDVLAAARFLLLPQDDLTLAALLKSPLIGFSEEALMELAIGRGKASLWEALRKKSEGALFKEAFSLLSNWLKQVDFLTPFELFSHILEASGGRLRLSARLGKQIEDPLNEFLQQVLLYEQTHIPSLQGCMRWLEKGAAVIKRDMEQGGDEVRIMTAHGSKGLQAPIVILADAHRIPNSKDESNTILWATENEKYPLPLWVINKEMLPEKMQSWLQTLSYRKWQEYYRLLYVAMTRAEDELYITGLGKGGDDDNDGSEEASSYAASNESEKKSEQSWYYKIKSALVPMAEVAEDGRLVVIKGKPTSPKAVAEIKLNKSVDAKALLPLWIENSAPEEPALPKPLSPSKLQEDESLQPVTSPLEKEALLRGQYMHALLQYLPEMQPQRRYDAALIYLKRHQFSPIQAEEMANKLLNVLEDEKFNVIFQQGSKAEVPIVGRIGNFVVSGQIDRLYVGEEKILLVDYKTNRMPPASVAKVPAAYLKQMAVYAALLQNIYPKKQVETALLWVQIPELMQLSQALLEKYLPSSYIVRAE